MGILQALLGIALLVLAFKDILATTRSADGAGRLTEFLSALVWRPLRELHRRRRIHGVLAMAGPAMTLLYVVVWGGLVWAGWGLVFTGALGAGGGQVTNSSDFFYFIGLTIVTLGTADYIPQGALWQGLTLAASVSCLLAVVLVLTYLLAVLSAVLGNRAFTSQIRHSVRAPEAFVCAGWNGLNLQPLNFRLDGLAVTLGEVAHHYRAYPILQYYHSLHQWQSPIQAALILEETLLLLRHGVEQTAQPSLTVLESAQTAVQSFVDALPAATLHMAPDAPPPPNLALLQAQGIPTVGEADFHIALEYDRVGLRILLGLLREQGWEYRPHRGTKPSPPGTADAGPGP